jgi:hypothetical protein
VYRLWLPSGEYYLKHYRIPGPRAALQNFIRPCKALLEWNAAERVAACGIPTAEPLAIGRTYAGWRIADSYLLTRAIPDTVPLHDFVLHGLREISGQSRARIVQQIARALGRIAGRLHRGRLAHHDFHPGNVLVRVTDGDHVRLWLIDLHAVSRRWWIRTRERLSNLAALGHFFTTLATPADRLRFFRVYWSEFHGEARSQSSRRRDLLLARAVRVTEEFCEQASAAAFRRHDQKWRRANRRVRILRQEGVRACGLAELGDAFLRETAQNPQMVFGPGGVREWLSTADDPKMALVTCQSGELLVSGRAACWADHGNRGWFSRLKPSRARRGWETGHALLRRRHPCVKPLLFVETAAGKGACHMLLLEIPPGAVPLDTWLIQSALTGDGRERRLNEAVRRLADLVQGLHALGFEHDALTLGELLVSTARERPQLKWAFPERIRQRRSARYRQRLRNLATLFSSALDPRICVTRATCARFLRRYLAEAAGEWKPWWRAIAAETEQLGQRCPRVSRRLPEAERS